MVSAADKHEHQQEEAKEVDNIEKPNTLIVRTCLKEHALSFLAFST